MFNFPIILDISSGICNAKCNWCFIPHLKKELNLNKFMKFEDVKKFVSINAGQDLKIYFTGYGEALANPDFFKIFELIGNNFRMGSMMTNFSKKLSKDDIRFMLLKLEKLVIEMGGLTPETRYKNMHIENDFFFENIKKLDEILKENVSLRRSCSVKIIQNKNNFIEMKNYDPNYSFNILKSVVLIYKKEFYNKVSTKTIDSFIEQNQNSNNEIYLEYSDNSKLETGCTTKKQLRIIPDGNILMCCSSPIGAYLYNAYEVPLIEVINSTKYKEYIQKMQDRTYCDLCMCCHE